VWQHFGLIIGPLYPPFIGTAIPRGAYGNGVWQTLNFLGFIGFGLFVVVAEIRRRIRIAPYVRGGTKARRKYDLKFDSDQIVLLSPLQIQGRCLLTVRLNRACACVDLIEDGFEMQTKSGTEPTSKNPFPDYQFLLPEELSPRRLCVRVLLRHRRMQMRSFRLPRRLRRGEVDIARIDLKIQDPCTVIEIPLAPKCEPLIAAFPVLPLPLQGSQ